MKVRLYASPKGDKETFLEITGEGSGYWFNMTTGEGGTESHPYGLTTRARIENLYKELGELLKSTKE